MPRLESSWDIQGFPPLGFSDGCGGSCLPSRILVALSSWSKTSLEAGGDVTGAIADAGIPDPPGSAGSPGELSESPACQSHPWAQHSLELGAAGLGYSPPGKPLGMQLMGTPWECSSWPLVPKAVTE